MSYLLGQLMGSLVITLLLTRIANVIVRKFTDARKAAAISFAVVLALCLAAGSRTMGLGTALAMYAPFLVIWLLVDLARRSN